jgi:hypothetical protein
MCSCVRLVCVFVLSKGVRSREYLAVSGGSIPVTNTLPPLLPSPSSHLQAVLHTL